MWGIGRRWSSQLIQQGINTAGQLKDACPNMMRRQFNVVLAQVVLELRGACCISTRSIEIKETKKGIVSSRSFSVPAKDFNVLMQALSSFCDIASKKLRHQKSVCGRVSIFLRTNAFSHTEKQHNTSMSIKLAFPSDDIRVITKAARVLLLHAFKDGYAYKKIGVHLDDLASKNCQQLDMWHEPPETSSPHVMEVYDEINRRFGASSIRLASSHFKQVERTKRERCSPKYTTSWSDLLVVRLAG